VRIFSGGIATETNSFSPIPTDLDDFAGFAPPGEASRPSGIDLDSIWGRIAAARGHEHHAGLMAWAEPGGTTTARAYAALKSRLLEDLRRSMPVDIVLLMLHGAMLADGCDNVEADIIAAVRALVGPAVIIGVELDLHCHLRPATIEHADVVLTYKEYPHIDTAERGAELYDLAVATRQAAIHPVMALFDCAMVGIYPTSQPALRSVIDAMRTEEGHGAILSISFAHDFPFADLPDLGARVLVVADGDRTQAETIARRIGHRLYAIRREIGFDRLSLPRDQALRQAAEYPSRPVVVADQSDNSGAGAPGDSTFALDWLAARQDIPAAIATLYDPETVRIANKVGVGGRACFRIGGKLGPTSGRPMDLFCEVLGFLADYRHTAPQAVGEPVYHALGDVAALRTGNIDIIVTSARCQCFSPSIFTDFGIDLKAKQIVIVKSYQHFHAAFEDVAARIIYMAGPGAVPPDPRQIPYTRLDRSRLYPWNPDPLRLDEGKPSRLGAAEADLS